MKTQNFWNDFEQTGKVADYLNFKGSSNNLEENKVTAVEEKVGNSPYAGFSDNNRNDNKYDTYR